MFIMEQEFTEADALFFIQEAATKSVLMKETLIDPVINALNKPDVRKKYIAYGESFLDANAEMLSREYPTKDISYPRKYVDNIITLFGYKGLTEFKEVISNILKEVGDSNFATLKSTPTNFIHAVCLYYSDMTINRQLRDSARQQLGLICYGLIFHKYFPYGLNQAIMAYTYMQLDRTFNLVKSENIINWIGLIIDTCYESHRSRLDLDISPEGLVKFLNRVRNTFNEAMKIINNRYHDYKEEGALVGDDLTGDEDHVDTNSYSSIRDSLMLMIKNGDALYTKKGELYEGVARYKMTAVEPLYEFATKKIEPGDIAQLMDLIFYVFLVKEGNKIRDINSTKYISRITNFPTAIDRAIPGKPVISKLVKKYKSDNDVVRTYVCFLATYILRRINDIIEEYAVDINDDKIIQEVFEINTSDLYNIY